MGWIAAVIGLAALGAAFAAILAQTSSGAQPWSSELSDNFVFARSIPFVIGLGVAVGLARGRSRPERRPDGAVRRFSRWTVVMHAAIAVGFLLALPTGAWQYFGGILDVSLPIPLHLIYRVHYIGAAIVLFAVSAFLVAWWVSGERGLLIPRGAIAAHLRGLAYELPRPVGLALARVLRLDLRPRPPSPGRFTFYETVVSFPTWAIVLTLITVTGLVKALRYTYPVPGPVLFWASTLHVAAMVMIGLKVLDHLRYTLVRWPLVVAAFTGWLKGAEPARAASPAQAASRAVGAGAGGDE
jgi:hypothetical protein